MAGWETKMLGELCEFQRGLTYGKSDEVDVSNNVVLRANNINLANHTIDLSELRYISDAVSVPAAKKVRKGSLLVCTASGSKSHLGKIAYIDNDYEYAFGGFMGQITPIPRVNGRYLFHVLTSPVYKTFIEALSDGVNINNLKFDNLRQFPIPVPSLDEQHRIVAILDEAFEGIATAKANAEKNLQNARELFDAHLGSVFAKAGEGWSVERVGAIADCCLGKMLDKAKNKGDLKPYLRNQNVRWFAFDQRDVQEMRFTPDEFERYSVRRGDVVICEGGYPGRAAIWDDDEPIFIQKALHRVRFSEATLGRWFLYYLYSQEASGVLRQHFTGTGIQHFTGTALSRLRLPIAPSAVVAALVERFDALAEEVTALEAIFRSKLAALDELKKTLLQQAFAGNLADKSTDRPVEVVT